MGHVINTSSINKMMLVMLIFVVIMLSDGCLDRERTALLDLKASIISSNETYISDWGSVHNCCQWFGVRCDDDTLHVINILVEGELSSQEIVRHLNVSILLAFHHLQYLRIFNMGIVDCVDNEGFGKLSSLKNLTDLDLMSNYLNNSIFSSINRISSLKSLNLRENRLERSFNMTELKDLNKLEGLDLSYNNITQVVFSEGLSNLEKLYLDENNIADIVFSKDLHKNSIKVKYICLDGASMDEKALHSLGSLSSLRNLSMLNFTLAGSNFSHWINTSLSSSFPNLRFLDLRWNDLNSIIPTGLCKLKNLQSLYMGGSNLIGTLPSCIGNLSSLVELFLSRNNLEGNLPSSLANLTSLASLALGGNRFRWDISLSPIKSLLSLETVHLEDNFIRIPCSLSPFFNHSRIESLSISNNEGYNDIESLNIPVKFQLKDFEFSSLNGNCRGIPRFLRNQHDLEDVFLSSFKLESKFPSWLLDNNPNLTNLYLSNASLFGPLHLPNKPHTKLYVLDLSNNFLNNNIPTSLGVYFPSLHTLSLSGNNFTDVIPSSISQISELEVLDLSNNNLQGKIPTWINNMSFLNVLNLANNSISGTIPPSFTPPFLLQVHLSRNRLTGTLDGKFNNSQFLETINLGHNHFRGAVPNLTIFYELKYLLLSDNELEGELPINLCKLNELSLIDFSHNDLFGKLPSCLKVKSEWKRRQDPQFQNELSYLQRPENLSDQYQKPLEFKTKSVSYLYQDEILSLISGIDISCNNLIGDIPPEFGNLDAMQVLNLSHNHLTGSIPRTFSNLRAIESLDLSYNNLSGNIPFELKNLYFLEVFSVAYNNLSGKTPDRVNQFATFDNDSYIGNSLLCGDPLCKSCKTESETPLPNSSNKRNEDGLIDIDSFYITFSVAYVIVLLGIAVVLYINPNWRKAWFYFIEVNMTKCYYYLVDSLPIPLRYRV